VWCIFFCIFYTLKLSRFVDVSILNQLILCTVIFPFYIYCKYYIWLIQIIILNLVVTKAVDYLGFYFYTIYSRFVYFIFPEKVIKLRETRRKLHEDVKSYIDTHITEVDPNYKEDRILFGEDREIDKKDERNEMDIIIEKNLKRKLKRNSVIEMERFSDYVSLN